MKPKHIYRMEQGKLVAHAHDGGCLVIQQVPLIGGGPDALIYLNRGNAEATVKAITEWLNETAT